MAYFENPAEGQLAVDLPDKEDVYLDYDRTHKVVINLRFMTNQHFGPELFGIKPLSRISLSNTLRVMSGRTYTWDETGLGLKYNKRTPTERNLRIRLEKKFRFGKQYVTFYGEAFNVLNEKVYQYSRTFNSFSSSGRRNIVRWEKQRDEILTYDEYPPYVTSYAPFLLSNQPRHYRFGFIFNF